MWKTLADYSAETGGFVHILPAETARIHCGAGDQGFLRKP
jgi:hypothetical protein